MKVIHDITGRRFELLVAIEPCGQTDRGEIIWRCACDCGGSTELPVSRLRHGYTKSCGCLLRAGPHHMCDSRLYSVWSNMKSRCTTPSNKSWGRYGGRGITVCDEWQEFLPFKDWALANGYSDALQIDRIDNDSGYRPDNCRFVTRLDNGRNRRVTVKALWRGRERPIIEIAEEAGVSYRTVYRRIVQMGMTADEAVNKPNMRPRVMVDWRGRALSLSDLADETGIPKGTLRDRILRLGMTAEEAVNLPRDTWATRRLRSH